MACSRTRRASVPIREACARPNRPKQEAARVTRPHPANLQPPANAQPQS